MLKSYPGTFITIEGGEGSGKTTLTRSLAEHLAKQGLPLIHTREPGGTALAEAIRGLLLSESKVCPQSELLLFLAARAQHLEELILPALQAGKIVLCERFNDSSIVYQGYARELGMDYVEDLCTHVCRGVHPDKTLFLDISPEMAFARLKRPLDRLEKEKIQFHQAVRQGYLHLADKYPTRITALDATLPGEALFDAALKCIHPLLSGKYA